MVNPEEDDVEPSVILGRSLMRLTKGITDFGKGIITIHPKLDPLLDNSEETKKFEDDWDHLLDIAFRDILEIDEAGLPPFEEATREALSIDICKRFSILKEERPVIKTMAYSDKYKKILDGIVMDKIKLDGEIKKEEEAIKQAEPMRVLKDVLCQVGVTTIIAKFLILDMPIDRDAPIFFGRGFLYTCGSILKSRDKITSTFDRVCHQTICAAKTSLNTEESDSDDEEDYGIQRSSFRAPMYGPKPAKYLNCNDPMDRALALHEVINSFRKIYVWKKTIGFLRCLPIPLQHMEWKPDYKGNFCKKEEGDGHWHSEIRLAGPYRNVYDQGFKTKPTKRKLSKYHKLSDVMSPNWFPE
ncbi:hypothetical protein Tco_0871021 [Tanacetum coccineum]